MVLVQILLQDKVDTTDKRFAILDHTGRVYDAVEEAARKHLPPELASWTEPTGGYLIWVSLRRSDGDEDRLQEVCQRHGVRVSPGSYYFSNAESALHFRLSISTLGEAEIDECGSLDANDDGYVTINDVAVNYITIYRVTVDVSVKRLKLGDYLVDGLLL